MLTKAQVKRRLKKGVALFLRIPLKNKEFSILSNNCWGGTVYDRYALPYRTPTIGLWIPPEDYIKLLENPKFYFNNELKQINYRESHVADLLIERKKSGRYDFDLDDLIIGRVVDVDIVFIHYKTFDDAKKKWDRRKQRINWDNLVVKFNDQNECKTEDYQSFLQLPYKNKLFFTAREEWCTEPYCIFLKQYANDGYVVNDTTHGDVPLDLTNYLNGIFKNNKTGCSVI